MFSRIYECQVTEDALGFGNELCIILTSKNDEFVQKLQEKMHFILFVNDIFLKLFLKENLYLCKHAAL